MEVEKFLAAFLDDNGSIIIFYHFSTGFLIDPPDNECTECVDIRHHRIDITRNPQ
jgi:hypothetical protein